MQAEELLARLCEALDAHAWDQLAPLLHDRFVCRYEHTRETFDRESWIRVNAEYPGFQRLIVEDVVAAGDRAVARCRVTATAADGQAEFVVATFVTAEDGQIATMTEVWTDVDQEPPAHARRNQG